MSKKVNIIDSGAILSDDNTHRYGLWRTWDYNGPRILFIGLNPSRADASYNDATIIRCINFAQGWGYGSMYFANLYSFRTPYVHAKDIPPDIEEQWLPLADNLSIANNVQTDYHLTDMIQKSQTVVCCWGNFKFAIERSKEVLYVIKNPHCFGTNTNGSPKHPLYLPGDSTLIKYAVPKT